MSLRIMSIIYRKWKFLGACHIKKAPWNREPCFKTVCLGKPGKKIAFQEISYGRKKRASYYL